MKRFKPFVIVTLATAMLTTSPLSARRLDDAYSTDTGGYGYEECRSATLLAPSIAFAAFALAGIIWFAWQSSAKHGH